MGDGEKLEKVHTKHIVYTRSLHTTPPGLPHINVRWKKTFFSDFRPNKNFGFIKTPTCAQQNLILSLVSSLRFVNKEQIFGIICVIYSLTLTKAGPVMESKQEFRKVDMTGAARGVWLVKVSVYIYSHNFAIYSWTSLASLPGPFEFDFTQALMGFCWVVEILNILLYTPKTKHILVYQELMLQWMVSAFTFDDNRPRSILGRCHSVR